MEEGSKPDSHLTSAAAIVEGKRQNACDDACSICLEDFPESDPSTVVILFLQKGIAVEKGALLIKDGLGDWFE